METEICASHASYTAILDDDILQNKLDPVQRVGLVCGLFQWRYHMPPVYPGGATDSGGFSRLAMFTTNDAVLPFPFRQALNHVDSQLDLLIYDAFPLPKAS